jgi:hypothetical protein
MMTVSGEQGIIRNDLYATSVFLAYVLNSFVIVCSTHENVDIFLVLASKFWAGSSV